MVLGSEKIQNLQQIWSIDNGKPWPGLVWQPTDLTCLLTQQQQQKQKELHEQLVNPVTEYMNDYRALLLPPPGGDSDDNNFSRQHNYVFVNLRGEPFNASSWSNWIQTIFEGKTGKRIGNNLLRSSFITHAYSNNISETLKHSIAQHMVCSCVFLFFFSLLTV